MIALRLKQSGWLLPTARLAPESIVVHIATKSDLIQSWERVMEWLPDVADAIYDNIPKPSSKIRFGTRKRSVRNDEKWEKC